MNVYVKRTLLCLVFKVLSISAFSQISYYKLSVGAGFGPTLAFADLDERSFRFGGYAEFNVNLTPFVSAGIELQAGQLKGGNINTNLHHREFLNKYKSVSLNIKGSLGELIDYSRNNFLNAVKGAYIGVGIGAVRNDLAYVVRYKPGTEAEFPPLGYRFPGEEKSTNLSMPLNAGINFSINDSYGDARYVLNFNYQTTLAFGEGLDGYNDPIGAFKNNAVDMYVLISAGLKYNFGPNRSTRRRF